MANHNFSLKSVCRMYSLCLFICFGLITTDILTQSTHAEEPPNFVLKWGDAAFADGYIGYAKGIASDRIGNIFVVGSFGFGTWRIQKFDNNGNFITKWGATGSDDGQFERPEGLVHDQFTF